jgi:hypothetical protein
MNLPPQAQESVDRIAVLLDEAERLGLDSLPSNEDAYALRATRDRYLPETLQAYAAVPAAMRQTPDQGGKTPDDLLMEQLTILERATAQRLARTADSARANLSANGRFLIDRLGSADSLPEAPAIDVRSAPLTARRFAETLGIGAKSRRDLVNAVATKLQTAFPLLTEVDRGLFGTGAARRAAITIPLGNDRLRYSIALDRSNEVETVCARIVRGVTIKTESVPLEEWARALFQDLATYAQSSRQTEQMLETLLR